MQRYNKLVTRLVHGTLRDFDLMKEAINDICQRFEFCCSANNIKDGDEAQRNQKKALFIMLVGQAELEI